MGSRNSMTCSVWTCKKRQSTLSIQPLRVQHVALRRQPSNSHLYIYHYVYNRLYNIYVHIYKYPVHNIHYDTVYTYYTLYTVTCGTYTISSTLLYLIIISSKSMLLSLTIPFNSSSLPHLLHLPSPLCACSLLHFSVNLLTIMRTIPKPFPSCLFHVTLSPSPLPSSPPPLLMQQSPPT